MQRRNYMALLGTTVAVGLAGCGGTLDADNEEMAENAIDAINDELSVNEWRLEDGEFFIEFVTSGDRDFDINVISGTYGAIVDDGFEYDAFLQAIDDDGSNAYRFEIKRDWAAEFMAGELSEQEYRDRIAATIE